MSVHISRIGGTFLRVWKRPPGPPFSPMTCLIPCLKGISQSFLHLFILSTAMDRTTKSAPSNASSLSTVHSTSRPEPVSSAIFSAREPIASSLSALMSWRTRFEPWRSPMLAASSTELYPNSLLPAPMSTMRGSMKTTPHYV